MAIAYISEASYAGTPSTDFVEVAVATGTDVSGWSLQIYTQFGNWLLSSPFPAPVTTISGSDVYVFNTNLSADTSVGIVDDAGSTIQYLSFYDPPVVAVDGDLAGQTPTYAGVTAASGESIQSDNDGASYYVQSTPNEGTIPCFATGMMVDCPGGSCPVEALKPGARVTTRDNGALPVCWTASWRQVFDRPDFSDRPIRVATGILGATRELVISAQHRILLCAADSVGEEVLVPAKALIGQPGIRQMRGKKAITWHHFAFASHEVIRVNGVWTESLLLGPMVMNGLPRGDVMQIRGLFPHATGDALNGPPARRVLPTRHARSRAAEFRALIRDRRCAAPGAARGLVNLAWSPG